jgi:hypothetical protein
MFLAGYSHTAGAQRSGRSFGTCLRSTLSQKHVELRIPRLATTADCEKIAREPVEICEVAHTRQKCWIVEFGTECPPTHHVFQRQPLFRMGYRGGPGRRRCRSRASPRSRKPQLAFTTLLMSKNGSEASTATPIQSARNPPDATGLSGPPPARSVQAHEDRSPPLRLNGRCRLRKPSVKVDDSTVRLLGQALTDPASQR